MNTAWKPLIAAACLTLAVTLAQTAHAQREKKKPDVSQEAIVMQIIGIDNRIAITYHRPGVKGRDVWKGNSENERIGPLVPRNGDPRPWRGGANETTTFETQEDILVEGKPLPAGKYCLAFIPTDTHWTVIFNSEHEKWGTFFYNAEKDILRVDVSPQEAPHQEWLIYGFDGLEAHAATAFLHWEEVKIPWRITMPQNQE